MLHHKYEDWLADLKATTPEEMPRFIYSSLKDKCMLHIFGRYYFPDIIQGDAPEFHHEMIDELTSPESSVIIEPRGHAKTTWARLDVIHDIVYGHEPFILFIGSNSAEAQNSFAFVKAQLESNEILRSIYGDLVPPFDPRYPRKWTDSHFETTNGIVCVAKGAGRGRGLNIKGKRPTKAIIDDMETDDTVNSELQHAKLRKWFYNVLIPSLDAKRGRFKMIGTVLHYNCIVLEAYKKFGGIKRAALEDKDGKASMEGKPIWPDYWPKDKLDKVKHEIGSFPFAQEYLNEPMSDEDSDVKLEWIVRVGETQVVDRKNKKTHIISTGLDPAIGLKDRHDETAMVTSAKKKEANDIDITVVGVLHGRWNETVIVENSLRVFDRWPHDFFLCESVAYQEVLRRGLGRAGVPAKPFVPQKDKRRRLQRIIGHIEFGRIKFGAGTEDLITQLCQFPNGKFDDIVDAFLISIEKLIPAKAGFTMTSL